MNYRTPLTVFEYINYINLVNVHCQANFRCCLLDLAVHNHCVIFTTIGFNNMYNCLWLFMCKRWVLINSQKLRGSIAAIFHTCLYLFLFVNPICNFKYFILKGKANKETKFRNLVLYIKIPFISSYITTVKTIRKQPSKVRQNQNQVT